MMEIMYSDWGLILGTNYTLAIGNKINDRDFILEWGLGSGILIRDLIFGIGIGEWGLGLRIGIRIEIGDLD